MPKVKLTYFDARARGELARLVMAAAKKEYEDVRVSFADWPALKAKSVFGTLPILEVDGKEHFQGMAIATYLAREHGLYGKTNMDGLIIDQIVQLKEDLLQEEAKVMFGSDESKAEAAKKLTETVYPRIMKLFEMFAKQGKGFVVADKLSLADIAIFEASETCSKTNPKILDQQPAIKALREKVAASPGIKEYLAKRKDSPL